MRLRVNVTFAWTGDCCQHFRTWFLFWEEEDSPEIGMLLGNCFWREEHFPEIVSGERNVSLNLFLGTGTFSGNCFWGEEDFLDTVSGKRNASWKPFLEREI